MPDELLIRTPYGVLKVPSKTSQFSDSPWGSPPRVSSKAGKSPSWGEPLQRSSSPVSPAAGKICLGIPAGGRFSGGRVSLRGVLGSFAKPSACPSEASSCRSSQRNSGGLRTRCESAPALYLDLKSSTATSAADHQQQRFDNASASVKRDVAAAAALAEGLQRPKRRGGDQCPPEGTRCRGAFVPLIEKLPYERAERPRTGVNMAAVRAAMQSADTMMEEECPVLSMPSCQVMAGQKMKHEMKLPREGRNSFETCMGNIGGLAAAHPSAYG